ncbi:hypothetical protein ACFLT9_02635 [Acidobacteriota bacterium]
MNFFKSSFLKKYLLPGFVFQSVVIAGGYGTGRELIEYFLNFGPLGGILGMLVSTLMWSVILAITFEFARTFKAYDYGTLFKKLLGPFWILFEILYILLVFLILAVLGSASGVILRDNFGLPYIIGVFIMLAAVGFLTFKGSRLIENFLSAWSIILYIIYGTMFVLAIVKFGPAIQEQISSGVILPGWAVGGFKYAFYNLACVAAVFFCLKHIETRKEALTAGILAGFIGIIPAFLFFVSVTGVYPQVLPVEIPSIFMLQKIGFPAFLIIFQVVLFGTLIETGTGLIHAVNERLQSTLKSKGKELLQLQRPIIAAILLLIAFGLSTFGLISLISKGYGTISWGFMAVYIIPMATIGLYRIIKSRRDKTN